MCLDDGIITRTSRYYHGYRRRVYRGIHPLSRNPRREFQANEPIPNIEIESTVLQTQRERGESIHTCVQTRAEKAKLYAHKPTRAWWEEMTVVAVKGTGKGRGGGTGRCVGRQPNPLSPNRGVTHTHTYAHR